MRPLRCLDDHEVRVQESLGNLSSNLLLQIPAARKYSFTLRPDYSKRVSTRRILSDNVKALMQADADLSSQAKLAKRAKIAQKSISNVLALDGPAPTLGTIEAIAKALKTAPWRLLHPTHGVNVLSDEELAFHRKMQAAYAELAAVVPKP